MLLGSLAFVLIIDIDMIIRSTFVFDEELKPQSTPEIPQGDSCRAGTRASKSLDKHHVRGKGFAEHS